MKLADAIREGAVWGDQVRSVFADGECRSCALGAAMIGAGIVSKHTPLLHGDPVDRAIAALRERFPELNAKVTVRNGQFKVNHNYSEYSRVPVGDYTNDLFDIINDMNFDVSREDLADWVESLGPGERTEQEVELVTV